MLDRATVSTVGQTWETEMLNLVYMSAEAV